MTKRKKQLLFYTLVGVFFIVGYLALILAFGYTYDFEQNEFVKTGSIYLNINTSSSVSVGGSKPKDTSLIRNDLSKKYLLPGVYNVEVIKEGYMTWYKKVQVPAGLVAAFNNIVLIPENIKPVILFPNLSYLSLNNNGSSAFYIDNNQQFGFVDYEESEINPISSRLTISPQIVSWDEKSNQFFVSNYATSKIIGDQELTIPIPSMLLNSSLVLRENNLISQTENSISIYDYKKGIFVDSVKNVSSFYVTKNTVYFINSIDYLLYEYDLDNQKITLVSGIDNFKGGKLLEVSEVDDALIILIDNNIQKMIFRINVEEIELVAKNVTDYEMSYDNKMLTWWDSDSISVYWIEDSKVQPFQKAGDTEKILLLKGISRAYWHKQNGHLIIFTERLVVFSEIDTRYSPNLVTLYDLYRDYDFGSKSTRSIKAGVYNGDSNSVFFRVGEELIKIPLEE